MTHLVNDVDGVAELLPLQERVQVVEQELEVVLPVPVGDDDGRPVSGLAAGRPVAPPPHHQGVLPPDLVQREAGREADVDWPACGDTGSGLMDRRQMSSAQRGRGADLNAGLQSHRHGGDFPLPAVLTQISR